LISDTYHLFKPGMNYAKGFDTWLFIRGQEYDAYRIPPPASRCVEDYVTKDYYTNYAGGRSYAELVAQFLANIDDWRGEDDWFAARVFGAAIDWVRDASRKVERFMLWVDCFDPPRTLATASEVRQVHGLGLPGAEADTANRRGGQQVVQQGADRLHPGLVRGRGLVRRPLLR